MAKAKSSGRKRSEFEKSTDLTAKEDPQEQFETWDPDDLGQSFGSQAEIQVAESTAALLPTEDYFQAQAELRERLFDVGAQAFGATELASGVSPFESQNIIGLALGEKQATGGFTGQLSVLVLVGRKLPLSRLSKKAQIGPEISGIPIDIVETGTFHSQEVWTGLEQPAKGGASIGHLKAGSGTLGCLVARRGLGGRERLLILSNNHVLANTNAASPGDVIVQPGTADPGPRQSIAYLEEFIPLQFSSGGPGPDNRVDGALAWTNPDLVIPETHGGMTGTPPDFVLNPNPIKAAPNTQVCKSGRTTGFTSGWVRGINAETTVGYNGGRQAARFVGQLLIQHDNPYQPFSLPGDSGSLIVTSDTRQPVGLLFSGGQAYNGTNYTMANPIEEVMRALRIDRFVASY